MSSSHHGVTRNTKQKGHIWTGHALVPRVMKWHGSMYVCVYILFCHHASLGWISQFDLLNI